MKSAGAWSTGKVPWIIMVTIASLACRSALGTVLDLPPPKPTAELPQTTTAVVATTAMVGLTFVEDTIRPPIETVRDRDSVIAMLPRDAAGNLDWVAALRLGTIKPRAVPPGTAVPAPDGFRFAFDFTYAGPVPMFDALFPHSSHTDIVACQQCHPRIFPYRNTPVVMADVLQGKYCGACHGKVAFSPMTACERCHRQMTLPPNRAQPVLLGDVTLGRVTDTAGNAGRVNVGELPRAVFPHWLHRIQYQCKACHVELFEAKAGANNVTMRAIADGQFCGTCHDGATAFRPEISNCQKCHTGSVGAP